MHKDRREYKNFDHVNLSLLMGSPNTFFLGGFRLKAGNPISTMENPEHCSCIPSPLTKHQRKLKQKRVEKKPEAT